MRRWRKEPPPPPRGGGGRRGGQGGGIDGLEGCDGEGWVVEEGVLWRRIGMTDGRCRDLAWDTW